MKRIIKKLVLAKPESDKKPVASTLQRGFKTIESIWHNKHQDDIGIEKILRLILASSQFLFPGLYLKEITGKRGIGYQELATDVYISIKVMFPLIMLYFNWMYQPVLFWLMIWLMIETLSYIAILIFASDIFSRPRSYKRSMLLMFLNYLQIILGYAVIYASGNYLNQPFTHWFDPVYFSLTTSSTVGYGEFVPVTPSGKMLVSSQIVIFFIVVVLFLNFFSNKVESKGYFDPNSGPSDN